MTSLKKHWRKFTILSVLAGMTFLLNLPGMVRCHGEVDTHAKSGSSVIDADRIDKAQLARSSQ